MNCSWRRLILFASIAGLAADSRAAVVTVTDANFGGATADIGVVTPSGTPASTVFTVSGVDIDGDSTEDPFDILVSLTSNDGEVTFNAGNNRYDTGGTDLDLGESLTVAFDGVTGIASGGIPISVANFSWDSVLATQFQPGRDAWQADQVNAGLGEVITVNTIALSDSSGFTVTTAPHPDPTNPQNGHRLRSLAFTIEVTAVPEPAALGLACLGALAGLASRRR